MNVFEPPVCLSLQAGARAIVVLMYWGKPHNLYPSEHTLSVARHFAALNVSLVLGDFPALSQKHAYFGKTFIVFSPGRLLVHESELCWQNVSPFRWLLYGCTHDF